MVELMMSKAMLSWNKSKAVLIIKLAIRKRYLLFTISARYYLVGGTKIAVKTNEWSEQL
jgi:hypothetical protein